MFFFGTMHDDDDGDLLVQIEEDDSRCEGSIIP
jgi:hypothetical protein